MGAPRDRGSSPARLSLSASSLPPFAELTHNLPTPRSVTKSSLISICNATMDAPFQSGMQNATFKFPVTVESEETVP